MSNEQLERVRELELQIERWQRVHQHEIEQERQQQSHLKGTLRLAAIVAAIGSIPAIFWLVCWALVHSAADNVVIQVFSVATSLVIYGIVAAGAARGAGLLAHYWFWRSSLNRCVATVAMTLGANALLMWWVIVLANW